MILKTGKAPVNFWSLNIYSDDNERLLDGEELRVSPKDLEGQVLSVVLGEVHTGISIEDGDVYSVVLDRDLWGVHCNGDVEMVAMRGMGNYDFDRFHVFYVDCDGKNISSRMNN